MTVTAGTSRSDYLGDGVQTEFPVGFQALVDADLAVYLTDPADISYPTKLVFNTQYTVAGDLAAGTAAVHLVTPPASGIQVSILRDIAISQATNYEQYDDFPADSHERALDKLTMICQALNEKFGRAVTYPVGSTLTGTTIPEPEAGQVLVWNAEETALINGPTATQVANANTAAIAAEASAVVSSNAAAAAVTAQGLAEAAQVSAESAETACAGYQAAVQTEGATQIGLVQAEGAAQVATVAASAQSYIDLAQEWAENPEDDAVTGHPGEYSAYHWSEKAKAAASGGAVKVSANDTTPGYLEAKVVASTGIVMATQGEGANETRSIAADVGTAANKILQLNASAQIPAVNGSLLTGLTAAQISGLPSSMPTGAVIAVAFAAAPSGFLQCDGAAINRTTYAALFAVIGTRHGYGDNSTTFNLPDYRGRFLRGWSQATTRDPDRATRTAMATGGLTGDNVGSVQADEFKSHTHAGNIIKSGGSQIGSTTGTLSQAAIGATGGAETRPINANVLYCIKY